MHTPHINQQLIFDFSVQDKSIEKSSYVDEHAQEWEKYYSFLQERIKSDIFFENFSLEQIYIPLRAYYTRYKDELEEQSYISKYPPYDGKLKCRVVCDLQTKLDEWIQSEDKGDTIRIISGVLGSGKSSFTRVYAAYLTNKRHIRVLHIPLHLFDHSKNLEKDINNFLNKSGLMSHNPLEVNSSSCLLIIFDGLDELVVEGEVGVEIAQDFIIYIEKTLKKYNIQKMRLKVLITGREIVIQTITEKYSRESQTLYLLPYIILDIEDYQYIGSQELLQKDQRDTWWKQYGLAIGEQFDEMPESLSGNHQKLDEITAQPLLNYLIALNNIYTEIEDFNLVNLNTIYSKLLKGIYERTYAEGEFEPVRGLSFGDFTLILEEIGLKIWHNGGRTTTLKNITQHCTTIGLSRELGFFKSNVESGVMRLLTAFYFHKNELHKSAEETFEFTHKSFGEYLTARRIVRALEYMNNIEDESEALKYWIVIYDKAPRMTEDFFQIIVDEIALKGGDVIVTWQDMLSKLISWMLKNGMPMHLFNKRAPYQEEIIRVVRAEEALLAALCACANITTERSSISWINKNNTAMGAWLSRLLGQRNSATHPLALSCLCYLNLSDCNLYMRDLAGANFLQSHLPGVNLMEANLKGANLTDTYLRGAELAEANLIESKLVRADLKWTNLTGVNLKWADLTEADLVRANLTEANLKGSNLTEAYLIGANLTEANLKLADLTGAYLTEAYLIGANLTEANLKLADLTGANLAGADLKGANLIEVHLTDTNLTGANLADADLRGANLAGADLKWVEFDTTIILPDGSKWTPNTDISRFTNPDHPNFWQPG